jgi:hypothetical protein
MKALAAAYPTRIKGPAKFIYLPNGDGDWTFQIDGVVWRYAGGKVLPITAKPDDYRYLGISDWWSRFVDTSPAATHDNRYKAAAEQYLDSRRQPVYSGHRWDWGGGSKERSPFWEVLWQAGSRRAAEQQQVWVSFLGWKVRLHKGIAGPIARVEKEILELEKTDKDITAWRKSLDSITAWNWRNIARTSQRSFHAYGTAVDCLPRYERNKETYWLWTKDKGLDYRSIPETQKQKPPDSVIQAFAREGFSWGGYWMQFDTMHFEYRPELFILGYKNKN